MNGSVPPSEKSLVRRELLPLPRPYVAPRTPTEQKLAEIWRTALAMDRVGIDDSYHDLGGDSFLAAVIFTMIKDAFAVTVPMAALVTSPTIAMLATKIDSPIKS
jgi:acyl carrier protein